MAAEKWTNSTVPRACQLLQMSITKKLESNEGFQSGAAVQFLSCFF